ncbi:uncharacterized protein LOC105420157 isoform X2 [Amborella trichopoda]|uniref:uncharacterized protein LOC105420157 isoform X2 n=1 Tax=Amborella trichopoda TaxID=13333 RepID=UPI0009BCDE1C|nr:uncharacterized protein LOC105420157 isoform X2 [Amborella trichopoda]|eukprot:XP_020519073.1 uncharacterized protein LOC105420157 isoform X2 [Amborella trichopoda]
MKSIAFPFHLPLWLQRIKHQILGALLYLKPNSQMWIGMGTAELVEYFKSYKPSKAKHTYGPQGQCALSVLVLEGSAIGYLDAQLRHKIRMDGTDAAFSFILVESVRCMFIWPQEKMWISLTASPVVYREEREIEKRPEVLE